MFKDLNILDRVKVLRFMQDHGITSSRQAIDVYNSAIGSNEADNIYLSGGGINIQPSHRGRLTELKERTGKTESELYNDGNPAHKKMVVFARNARKWKHDDGGHLFQGLTESELYTPEGFVNYYPFDDAYTDEDYDIWKNILGNTYGLAHINKDTNEPEVLLPEFTISESAIQPNRNDINYDKFVSNTYDALLRGDVNWDWINSNLRSDIRNNIRGEYVKRGVQEGLNKAGSVLFPYVVAGALGGLPAIAAYAGAEGLNSTVNNATKGESETWGQLLNNTFNLNAGPAGMFALESSNPFFWLNPMSRGIKNAYGLINGTRIPEWGFRRFANDATSTATEQLKHMRSNHAVRLTVNRMLDEGYHDAASAQTLRDMGKNMTYRTGEKFDAMLSLDANGTKQFRIVAPRYDNWSVNHELGHNVDLLGDHLSWRQTQQLAPGYNYFEGISGEDIPLNIDDIARIQAEELFADIFANTYSKKLPYDFNTTPGLKNRINTLNGYRISGTGQILDSGFGLNRIARSYYDVAPIYDLQPNEYLILNRVPDNVLAKNTLSLRTNNLLKALKPSNLISKYKTLHHSKDIYSLPRALWLPQPSSNIYNYKPYQYIRYGNTDAVITPSQYITNAQSALNGINNEINKLSNLASREAEIDKIIKQIDDSKQLFIQKAEDFQKYLLQHYPNLNLPGIRQLSGNFIQDVGSVDRLREIDEMTNSPFFDNQFVRLLPDKSIAPSLSNGNVMTQSIPIEFNGILGTLDVEFISTERKLIPDYFGWRFDLQNGKIPNKTGERIEIHSKNSKEITDAVQSRLNEATSAAGDNGVVVGSTRLIAHGDIAGTPHDIEFLTTNKRAAELQKQIGFTQTGVTGKGTGITGHSKFGQTDINIIPEDGSGVHGRLVAEYLSNMFPESYRQWKMALADSGALGFQYFPKVKNGEFIFDPKDPSGSELMKGEEFYNLIKDEENIRKQLISDTFSVTSSDLKKQKFIKRSISLLTDLDKTGIVKSVLERKGKALFGDDYKTLTLLYPNINLENIDANKKFLLYVGLPDIYANNPEIMNNILEEWVMEMESVVRGFGNPAAGKIKDALLTNFAYNGGSYSGPGGNTLTHSTGGGADVNVGYIGIMRSNIVKNRNNVNNASDLVDAITNQTSDIVNDKLLTDDGRALLNNILKQNNIVPLDENIAFSGRNGELWTDIVFQHINTTKTNLTLQEKLNLTKQVINKIADEFGVTAIRTHGYGKTYVGVYDIPDVLSYQSINPTFRSETGYEPGNIFKTNTGTLLESNQTLTDRHVTYDEKFINKEVEELQQLLDKYGIVKEDNGVFKQGDIFNRTKIVAMNMEVIKKTNKIYQYYARKLKTLTEKCRKTTFDKRNDLYGDIARNADVRKALLRDEKDRLQYSYRDKEEYERLLHEILYNIEQVQKLEDNINDLIRKTGRDPSLMSEAQKDQLIKQMQRLHNVRIRMIELTKGIGIFLGVTGGVGGLMFGTLSYFADRDMSPLRDSEITEDMEKDYRELSNTEFQHKYNGHTKHQYRDYIRSQDRYGNKKTNGGQIIWDNNGLWSHPGQITGITGTNNGTDITMKGVADYLYGIDNLGTANILEPGKNYHFPGSRVVEYPMTHRRQIGGYAPNIKYTYFDDMPELPDYSTLASRQALRAGINMNPSNYNKVSVVQAAAPYILDMYERHPANAALLPKFMDRFILDTYNLSNTLPVHITKPSLKSLQEIVDFIWAMENKNHVGINKDGTYSRYNDPNGRDYDVGPGLVVGSAIGNKPFYTKQELDLAAYNYYIDSMNKLLPLYDNKYGNGEFDKLDDSSKMVIFDVMYRVGQNGVNPTTWPGLFDAAYNNDVERLLQESRSTFRHKGTKNYDNARVERVGLYLYPEMFEYLYKNSLDPGLKVVKKQYGGVLKPFSYLPIPIVRF